MKRYPYSNPTMLVEASYEDIEITGNRVRHNIYTGEPVFEISFKPIMDREVIIPVWTKQSPIPQGGKLNVK